MDTENTRIYTSARKCHIYIYIIGHMFTVSKWKDMFSHYFQQPIFQVMYDQPPTTITTITRIDNHPGLVCILRKHYSIRTPQGDTARKTGQTDCASLPFNILFLPATVGKHATPHYHTLAIVRQAKGGQGKWVGQGYL